MDRNQKILHVSNEMFSPYRQKSQSYQQNGVVQIIEFSFKRTTTATGPRYAC